MLITIIEYRNPVDGKLKDLIFDEPEHHIQREINNLIEWGATDITVVENPNNFDLITTPQ